MTVGNKSNTPFSENDLTPWKFQKSPALVAHRGFARHFPENTLPALAAAVDAGASFLEFDIQLSKDRVPFLQHDDTLKRTAGIDASVFDLYWHELEKIGVGEQARLGGRFHDVRPITLQHLVNHLNEWPNVHCFIEIKRQSIELFGLETTMQAVGDAIEELRSPFSIISFRDDVIEYVHQHTQWSAGWVLREWNDQSLARLRTLGPDFAYFNYRKLPADTALPEGPVSWVFYEVTDPAVAIALRELGAHMIETMHVQSMLRTGIFGAEFEDSNKKRLSP